MSLSKATAGLTLMPGMIDAHVHVYAAELHLTRVSRRPWTYLAHHAATFLRHMLQCGYTTVRDTGGGDYWAGARPRRTIPPIVASGGVASPS